MSKRIRQQAVLNIVDHQHIPNQTVLAKELEKLNFSVTQATVSRDITELELLKSTNGYACPKDREGTVRPLALDTATVLRLLVAKIDTVQNFVVIRTLRSSAQQIGRALDDTMFSNMLGNICGDDTVLIITASPRDAQEMKSLVLDLIG
jgi:transcriptional regulator of arginine metabolism